MHVQPSAPPAESARQIEWFPDTHLAGVRVADGYGVKISVHHGRLRIADGIGRHRRSNSYSRATCPFRRLLILGHSGYVTLQAIRWCWDLGIGVIQVDSDRNLLLTSAKREIGASRIRRVQALAPYTEIGVEAARLLMRTKIEGQALTLVGLPGGRRAGVILSEALAAVEGAGSIAEILVAESTAALAYWESWATIPIHFTGRAETRVPEQWHIFGTRTSPVSGTKRYAANPANALLNYLYSLLEAETTLALHAAGLDPALGIWHTDEPHRDSLTLDVMEATRPIVDRYVLGLLKDTTFRAQDFQETRTGSCRILPPLTHRLAEAMPALAAAIEPSVLELGRLFDRTIQPVHTEGFGFGKPRRSEHKRTTKRTTPTELPNLAACRRCGTLLPNDARDFYCTACAPDRPAGAAAGIVAARMSARVSQARRDVMRRRAQAVAEWNRTHLTRPDRVEFTDSILPQIQGVSISALSRASGLSRRYCKLILIGETVPHPLHWEAFRTCANQS
jgi:CRISPR-associated protein Cas1